MGGCWCRIALVVLGVVTLATAVRAGEIHVPDRNPAGEKRSFAPFNTYPEWRYQMLLPKRRLGHRPFEVTDISISPAFSTKGTWTASQFQLRIANTTRLWLDRSFAVNLGPKPTVLHNGALSFAYVNGTWSSLGISGTFQYDGVSNLVLEIRYKGGLGIHGLDTNQADGHPSSYTHSGLAKNAYNSPDSRWPSHSHSWGMRLRFTTRDAQITPGGTGKIGSVVDLNLIAPSWPGEVYQAASSLGSGPTPIGNRSLGLRVDNLMLVSVRNLAPTIFRNYRGKLDPVGRAKASIRIPQSASLIGVRFYTAFLVIESGAPLGIAEISSTTIVTIR